MEYQITTTLKCNSNILKTKTYLLLPNFDEGAVYDDLESEFDNFTSRILNIPETLGRELSKEEIDYISSMTYFTIRFGTSETPYLGYERFCWADTWDWNDIIDFFAQRIDEMEKMNDKYGKDRTNLE